jgi:hypothetical protein
VHHKSQEQYKRKIPILQTFLELFPTHGICMQVMMMDVWIHQEQGLNSHHAQRENKQCQRSLGVRRENRMAWVEFAGYHDM